MRDAIDISAVIAKGVTGALCLLNSIMAVDGIDTNMRNGEGVTSELCLSNSKIAIKHMEFRPICERL